MKKIAWALITILLFGVTTIKAQEQELSVSEPISSGCLPRNSANEQPTLPTIKLTKEGSILSIDLFNYTSNCGTTGFEVENKLFDDNNDTPILVISVIPIVPVEADCTCPFNISYTVRNLENNSFYLTCWWYEGLVELTEGEPLVLEYKTEDAVIDGLKYRLLKTSHLAKLINQVQWDGESDVLQIPSEVEYEGEKYSVTTIVENGFWANNAIKKIIIPKTIKNTQFGSLEGITNPPFTSCPSLEAIEVEEENPVICSIDGVLFNKDKTTIIDYPIASRRELYTVPDGVKTVAMGAFFNSLYLKKVVLPNSMEALGYNAFYNSKSLEEVILSSNIKELPGSLFKNCLKLKSVVIPEGVTSIGYSAFEGCSSLDSISLPESVAKVESAAFADCTSLKSATLSPNLNEIPSGMFRDCSNLAEVVIPFGITTIGSGAFRGCEAMQTFDLPESINYIDGFAFRYIPNLKDIYCHAETVPNTDKNAFGDVDLSQATLHVPAASLDNYQSASPWKNFGAIVPLHPFLKEGKTWNYQEYHHNLWNDEQWTKDVSYVINGTTEIDGKTYYKMYRRSEEGNEYYCALREEGRKVWQYTSEDGDHLIYDFGMSVGDRYMPSWDPYYYQLTAVKPMRFHNNQQFNVLYYDVFNTDPVSYFTSALIVEGVGCEKGWNIMKQYAPIPTNGILHGEDFVSCYEDGKCIFTADDFNDLTNPNPANDIAYRPFVEEDKVWKVGTISGNPVQVVDYYYFDGDTIIGGKTWKQMMCQRYVSPDFSDEYWTPSPSLGKVGAWYEEDKKVYFFNEATQAMQMKYDFSLHANDTLQFLNVDGLSPYIIGPRQTGGIEGFKGAYRDIMMCTDAGQPVKSTTWLEGVGDIYGPTRIPRNLILGDPVPEFLMSCAVGDEVIYLNDAVEDGATPEGLDAPKNRFDFTHTIKTQPTAPRRSGEASGMSSLYGEYNDLQLGINLDPLDDAYQVSITGESGQAVYEKAIDAGTIVALSIDISAYAKGRYTVTVENSREAFTGEFELQPTRVEAITNTKEGTRHSIYNLQGQRISSLRRGLNIVNGQKVYVK